MMGLDKGKDYQLKKLPDNILGTHNIETGVISLDKRIPEGQLRSTAVHEQKHKLANILSQIDDKPKIYSPHDTEDYLTLKKSGKEGLTNSIKYKAKREIGLGGKTAAEISNIAERGHFNNLIGNDTLLQAKAILGHKIIEPTERELINLVRPKDVVKMSPSDKSFWRQLIIKNKNKIGIVPGMGSALAGGVGLASAIQSGDASAAVEPMAEMVDPSMGFLMPEKIGTGGRDEPIRQMIEEPKTPTDEELAYRRRVKALNELRMGR